MAQKQNHFFAEIVEALRVELEKLGIRSSVSHDGFPDPRSGLVYVLVPPHEFFALERRSYTPNPRLLARTIFLCAEQPSQSHFEENVQLAPIAGAVFDINAWAVSEYRLRGISVEHLPLGYSTYWDRYASSDAKDLDAVFLGAATPRRGRYLAMTAPYLSRLRTRIILTDNSGPNYRSKENFLVGEEKLDLLRRSKVVINIHQGEDPYFEWQRVLEAVHCGCVVVTEHSIGYQPLVPGKHFISGRPDVLGQLASEVLQNEDLRSRVRQDAYDFIRQRRPLRESAERLVAAADRLDRTTSHRLVRSRQAAAPQPKPELPAPAVASARLNESTELMRMALKEIRLDMMELRRDQARARIAERERESPPAVRRVWASPAYLATSPRVSVVTALYNQRAWVLDAARSVELGTFRDFELIVVDDGSSDGSLEVVERWSRERPELPLLLLTHPVNRGLPRARNTGLDFARGPYTFILDSDNELLPNCLDRLVAALDRDTGAAFAYGILACFNDGGGYTHLMDEFPWEPVRLRNANYIDAMALFRTHVLRNLGGYTTDRRLYGWEDYDLYCRMAETGRRGAFVQELVGRYRTSSGSMLSLTDLSWTSARNALRQRCPKLMEGGLIGSAEGHERGGVLVADD